MRRGLLMCRRKWRMTPRTVPMMLLLLSGCAGATPEYIRACPSVVVYSRADQQKWADEVDATPKGSMLRRITDDYISLRDQARDCAR